jgi:AcrR family transcriptional regulator
MTHPVSVEAVSSEAVKRDKSEQKLGFPSSVTSVALSRRGSMAFVKTGARATEPAAPDGLPPVTPLRRRPRQARAVERFERILDTAEQVFAEIGYDAATTNQIAAMAETSVGSLYEFFPNKAALAGALAERYVDRIGSLYDTLIVPEPSVTGSELVVRVVDALDQFYREHPGAIPLLNGRSTSDELAAAAASLQKAMVRRIDVVLTARRPDLPAARRSLMAQVIAEMARSLLVLADEVPLHQRHAVVRETERAIVGYLTETAPLPI